MNGRMPVLLTVLAAALFVALLLLTQPYSSVGTYDRPARQYVEAALRQDSVQLARLSAADTPVVWALNTARTHGRLLALWTGRTQTLTGRHEGDTTEVFMYPSGEACSNAPIRFSFVGTGSDARVLIASSHCPGLTD